MVGAAGGRVAFYSTVVGGLVDGGGWARVLVSRVREPVRFAPMVDGCWWRRVRPGVCGGESASGVAVAVEEASEAVGGVVVGSLRRGWVVWGPVLGAVARLFVGGVGVDWAAVVGCGLGAGLVGLPTYAFCGSGFGRSGWGGWGMCRGWGWGWWGMGCWGRWCGWRGRMGWCCRGGCRWGRSRGLVIMWWVGGGGGGDGVGGVGGAGGG